MIEDKNYLPLDLAMLLLILLMLLAQHLQQNYP